MLVPTHSCDACASLVTFVWDNDSDQNLFSLTLPDDWRSRAWIPIGRIRYGDAVEHAQNGCDLMELLTTSCPRDDPSDLLVAGTYYIEASRYKSTYGEQYPAFSSIRKIEIFFAWQSESDKEKWSRAVGAVLCALQSDPSAAEIAVRPPNMCPDSPETMQLARGWLQECVAEHKQCVTSDAAGVGPKRLLRIDEIDGELLLRVVECSDLSTVPHYAALSYCWGGQQTVVLNCENRDAWADGLPASAIPKTIHDACNVTRDLGLNHLWVDSLCIAQSDNQEKLREIAAMGAIYEHAHITISASRAASADEGFLHPRHAPEDLVIPMPYQCNNGQPASILLWFNRQPQFSDPISRRAWTYQEATLSRRLLTIGSHQTRWNCRAIPPTTARVDGWTDGNHYVMSGFVDWEAIDTSKRKKHVSARQWKSVVQHYTGRTMSDPGDRLAAISAVAKKLQGDTGGEYLAGLWQHCLPELLMWDASRCVEPPVYTAPSWSWASMLGQVYFLYSLSGPHGVEVVDFKMETPVPHDPHGPVVDGFLRLRGMVAVATLGFEWDESLRGDIPFCRPHRRKRAHGLALERRSEFVRGNLDLEPPELVEGAKITVWMLRLDGDHSSRNNRGLLLLRLADGAFCRIGIYSGLGYGKPYIPWRPMDLILSRKKEWDDIDRFEWEIRCMTVV
ncbi:heterokaryon incompatibility protein-domain-containing protein [Immersiella caudata]|uniref:Heterokaryon incompatibility protein-domain-containing protein n=1 Tax=Immersiella caudata TaxID=314043 RepID=A0AA39U632_9PEZI|nr:heterokaryon incompatibility protein-domain-containing protein [Immersiella caudata]